MGNRQRKGSRNRESRINRKEEEKADRGKEKDKIIGNSNKGKQRMREMNEKRKRHIS
jgi:hypothetical protein